MSFPKINFTRDAGGLGRPLSSDDHISALIMPVATADLPSGFTATDRTKIVYSVENAESLGIIEQSLSAEVQHVHSQIVSFFDVQPKGKLYVNLYDNLSSFENVPIDVQSFANGEIRQMGIYFPDATITVDVNELQLIADTLESNDMPCSFITGFDLSTITDVSTLDDLRSLDAKNVSVVIGGVGVPAVGLALGTVALSKVHENIGWIGKFNVAFGSKFDVPEICVDAIARPIKSFSQNELESIHDKGYIFIKKHVGVSGSYWNDSMTAISETSDFAYIENNRTIDKAIRNVRSFMLPNLNSPLYVNTDGTLSGDTIGKFQNDCERGLESMERDGELSAFVVTINPVQDVLATSKIEIAIKIVPVGVAREIDVKIGFAVSVS